MLERRRILLTPTRAGVALADGDTGAVVGTATPNRPPDSYWFGWLADARRKPQSLEVREPPDGSLVFTLTRSARVWTLTDGQDHAVWTYRIAPGGLVISAAKGAAVARIQNGRVLTTAGSLLGVAEATRAEFAPDLDGRPFEKMLVLGAALGILMDSTGRRSAAP